MNQTLCGEWLATSSFAVISAIFAVISEGFVTILYKWNYLSTIWHLCCWLNTSLTSCSRDHYNLNLPHLLKLYCEYYIHCMKLHNINIWDNVFYFNFFSAFCDGAFFVMHQFLLSVPSPICLQFKDVMTIISIVCLCWLYSCEFDLHVYRFWRLTQSPLLFTWAVMKFMDWVKVRVTKSWSARKLMLASCFCDMWLEWPNTSRQNMLKSSLLFGMIICVKFKKI